MSRCCISLADAKTLFHEFGHALHCMLQNVRYPGLASHAARLCGTAVAAERALAAQPRAARSLRAPLPDGRADAAGARRQDRALEQVQSGVRHTRVPVGRDRRHGPAHARRTVSTTSRRSSARRSSGSGACRGKSPCATGFRISIICSATTSYSAGYYSYLWSDVMAADAWQAFVEAGGAWDAERQRSTAHAYPVGRQLDRSRRSIPAIPRP